MPNFPCSHLFALWQDEAPMIGTQRTDPLHDQHSGPVSDWRGLVLRSPCLLEVSHRRCSRSVLYLLWDQEFRPRCWTTIPGFVLCCRKSDEWRVCVTVCVRAWVWCLSLVNSVQCVRVCDHTQNRYACTILAWFACACACARMCVCVFNWCFRLVNTEWLVRLSKCSSESKRLNCNFPSQQVSSQWQMKHPAASWAYKFQSWCQIGEKHHLCILTKGMRAVCAKFMCWKWQQLKCFWRHMNLFQTVPTCQVSVSHHLRQWLMFVWIVLCCLLFTCCGFGNTFFGTVKWLAKLYNFANSLLRPWGNAHCSDLHL